MEVRYIPSAEINSDLGIVNAARVSLNKKSQYLHTADVNTFTYCANIDDCINPTHWVLSDQDTKLIHYLAKNNHWTPFAHSRLYFEVQWSSKVQELYFYKNYNQGGFAKITIGYTEPRDYIKGSLYSWINNRHLFTMHNADYIKDTIAKYYPVASKALSYTVPTFTYNTTLIHIDEETIASNTSWFINEPLGGPNPKWNILTTTLLVKVPIFIARQIRTSQVGIAYSDLYVEGEAFTFNEVSRRYVNDELEFYAIPQWRIREGTNVKQGSTGVADTSTAWNMKCLSESITKQALDAYTDFPLVAPEQARALLPQSMYTQFYMTATLHRWAQFLALRLDKHVQEETRQVALLIKDTLSTQYPIWAKEYSL